MISNVSKPVNANQITIGIDKAGKSVNFYLMQTSQISLTKQAVNAALKGEWKKAIEFNKQLLEQNPADVDSKVRLGRAFLQTEQFGKAKKLFKEVLDIDPINTIAQKNYNLAKEKVALNTPFESNPKALIIEPGTTTEVSVRCDSSAIDFVKVPTGQELSVKQVKNEVRFYLNKKLVGICKDEKVAGAINRVKKAKSAVTATYLSNKGDIVNILLKSGLAVFKSEKQPVKPYLKKGTIKEPELEIENMEEDEETE